MNRPDTPGVIFAGGSGDSPEEAIVIQNAGSHHAGINAEYLYLQKQFGERDVHWKLVFQALLKGEKRIDWMVIELTDGTTKSIYFDTSEFFGKR
jgi:hypothetical protein